MLNCNEINSEELTHTVRVLWGIPLIAGLILLFIFTIFILVALAKNLNTIFQKAALIINILTGISSLLIGIYFVSGFINPGYLRVLEPFVYSNFSKYLFVIVFPALFAIYLAWRKEIKLIVRYGIILSYVIIMIPLISAGTVFTFEQIIYGRKVCLGITCPVQCNKNNNQPIN